MFGRLQTPLSVNKIPQSPTVPFLGSCEDTPLERFLVVCVCTEIRVVVVVVVVVMCVCVCGGGGGGGSVIACSHARFRAVCDV